MRKSLGNFMRKNYLLLFQVFDFTSKTFNFRQELTENSYEGKINVPTILHKRKQARHYLRIEFLKLFRRKTIMTVFFVAFMY